jgi:ribosome-binding ATPase
MIADIQSLEKKLPERERKAKSQDKEAIATLAVVRLALTKLKEGVLLYMILDSMDDAQVQLLQSFHLLTTKPFVYALNVAEDVL